MTQQPTDDRRPAWEGGTYFPPPSNLRQPQSSQSPQQREQFNTQFSSGQYPPVSQQSYQQGYSQSLPQSIQSPMSQMQAPQMQRNLQEIKFYKSGWFGIQSAAGKLQRDCNRMTSNGWKLQHTSFVGLDFWLRRIVVAIYEK